MDTAQEQTEATAIAATRRMKPIAAPRLRFSAGEISINHPDPEIGEQAMAEILGVTDRDAMYGILRQLLKASVKDSKPDPATLAFMISMVESIKPRDSIEAMLVTQMVSVHVMAMRCANHLANADDLARQDSASRALGKDAGAIRLQEMH